MIGWPLGLREWDELGSVSMRLQPIEIEFLRRKWDVGVTRISDQKYSARRLIRYLLQGVVRVKEYFIPQTAYPPSFLQSFSVRGSGRGQNYALKVIAAGEEFRCQRPASAMPGKHPSADVIAQFQRIDCSGDHLRF
jgi:hypothetical protein